MTAKWFQALVGLLKSIWKKYDIQGIVLTSLGLQFLLVLLAPLRKRSKNGLTLLIIWLCYLLADYCATFAIGLISREESTQVLSQIAAFWAPFLLLHLGAPHNITALAMDDNDLWHRHLLTLIAQVPLVLLVFYRYQIHRSDLLLPAAFILAAGIFKYAERVRSLYLASLPSIRRGILLPSHMISKLDERQFGETSERSITKPDELEILQRGYLYYQCFIRFVIDHTFAHLEDDVAKKFFSRIGYEDAFKVMEVELNFMYDAIFTKMATVRQINSWVGCTCISSRFVCHALIVIVGVIFFFSPKYNVDPHDISITYALLGGALVLDFIAFVNVMFSEWTIALLKNKALKLVLHWDRKRWIWSSMTSLRTVNTINSANRRISSSKRWSRKMTRYSLINHSLNRRWKCMDQILNCFGLKERIDSCRYTTTAPVECYLMKLVFECIKKKGVQQQAEETTGDADSRSEGRTADLGGHSSSLGPLSRIIPQLGCQNQYEKCVLVLHVATEICYFTIKKEGDVNPEMCTSISEYLAYLLLMEGLITTTVPGMRFRDVCWAEEVVDINGDLDINTTLHLSQASHLDYIKYMIDSTLKDIRHFFTRNKNAAAGNTCRRERWEDLQRERTCVWLLNEYVEGRVLMQYSAVDWIMREAVDVARYLEDYSKNPDNRPDDVENQNQSNVENSCHPEKEVWEDVSQVWIELLLYTASHCRGDVQYLSRGGEFLTFVRLLMAHFGLREWFKEGEFQLDAQIH